MFSLKNIRRYEDYPVQKKGIAPQTAKRGQLIIVSLSELPAKPIIAAMNKLTRMPKVAVIFVI